MVMNRKNILYLLSALVVLLSSCSLMHKKVQYFTTSHIYNKYDERTVDITLFVPDTCLIRTIDIRAKVWEEHRVSFADAAFLCITKEMYISELYYYEVAAFDRIDDLEKNVLYGTDTLTLQGVKNGRYWKHCRRDGFTIGYTGVKKQDLKLFEDIIKSIRVKYKIRKG